MSKVEKLKGVGGWLLLFVIILTFITPAYLLFDVIANPSFYSFSSGVYDLSSIIWVFGIAIWSIVIGISLWNRKEKAVIWAKEFLIVSLVLGVFFIFFSFDLYTSEEQDLLFVELFRSIIFFVIWFSYLNASERVKNTFKDRKINWKRLGIIFLIALGTLFLITILSSLFPQNIETAGFKVAGTPLEFEQEYTLNAETAQYHEFTNQNIVTDSIIEFQSIYPISVLLVKSEQEFDNFIEGLDYEIYEGCFVEEQNSGEIRCTISTGGLVVWNYNSYGVNYTLRLK